MNNQIFNELLALFGGKKSLQIFIEKYATQCEKYLSEIALAMKDHDRIQIRKIIHQWYSSSATMGAEEVSTQCRIIRKSLLEKKDTHEDFMKLRSLHVKNLREMRDYLREN